jgi:hypothetical protein
MILFSSKKLEHKISNNELAHWEKTKYLIFTYIFFGSASFFNLLSPNFHPKPTWQSALDVFGAVLFVLITYFGIKKCYMTNKESDNTDFIDRIVILSVPMILKIFLIYFFLFFLYFNIKMYFWGKQPLSGNLIYCLFSGLGPVLQIFFYIFLNRSFRRLTTLMRNDEKLS